MPDSTKEMRTTGSNNGQLHAGVARVDVTPEPGCGLGVINQIIPEPPGGAYTDHRQAAHLLKSVLLEALDELTGMSPEELITHRYEKFRRMAEPSDWSE